MKQAQPQPQRDTAPPVPVTAVRSTRVFHLLAGVSARRVRGLSLLACLSLVLVVPPLTAFSVLPWWAAVVAFAVLVADLVWLRRAAVAERASTRAGELGRRSAKGSVSFSQAYSAESGARRETQAGPVRPPGGDDEDDHLGPAPLVAAAQVPDPVVPPVEVDPSAWSPVPVPPPTYTLKATAPEPVSLPVPVAVPELGTSECWSLAGMVYDCDLEELVERRSATGA